MINKNKAIYSFIKRVFDIFFSIFMLILTSPILIFFIIAIRIESTGSPFYKQIRVGKKGKIFYLYKLRSMYEYAENQGPKLAEINDIRVTKIGKIIRNRKIDEIPQFINILKGDMSLIGPRPERPYFIELFSKDIPNFNSRLLVHGGLTGWAQVMGNYHTPPKEKLALDLYYIENRSLYLDILIIINTVKIILGGMSHS